MIEKKLKKEQKTPPLPLYLCWFLFFKLFLKGGGRGGGGGMKYMCEAGSAGFEDREEALAFVYRLRIEEIFEEGEDERGLHEFVVRTPQR